MTTALCPGSFDPPTNGHVDVIERAIQAFDRVVIAVVDNPSKDSLFTTQERVAMLDDLFGDRAEIGSFQGLLVDYAGEVGANVVVPDPAAGPGVGAMETVFMATRSEWSFISSSLVKEVAKLGGSIGGLVPGTVEKALQERLE